MNIWSKVNTYGLFSAEVNLDDFVPGVCYVYDSSIQPFVNEDATTDDNMSLAWCNDYCSTQNEGLDIYYAVQGGNRCMCGREFQGIQVKAVPQSLCDTKCAAETSTDVCGGENYFNLYKIVRA